jgi:ABC-type transporter lipoprotein component MlaA
MGFSEYEKEDYGQTLGVWGVGPGCYVVLPVIGPSTIRDTTGSFIIVVSNKIGIPFVKCVPCFGFSKKKESLTAYFKT